MRELVSKGVAGGGSVSPAERTACAGGQDGCPESG